MARELARCEISHNDIGEIDRGKWRKYNPYNPYVEEKDDKEAVDNLKIDSLDDLFDDLDSSSSKERKMDIIDETKKDNAKEENTNISDLLDFNDEEQVLPKQEDNDESSYDLQKELEAKFDELFGPMDNQE